MCSGVGQTLSVAGTGRCGQVLCIPGEPGTLANGSAAEVERFTAAREGGAGRATPPWVVGRHALLPSGAP